jgi:hypothetical protein
LWLAETSSQQPISQTTWLKVTPHCNHCFSLLYASGGHLSESLENASFKELVEPVKIAFSGFDIAD